MNNQENNRETDSVEPDAGDKSDSSKVHIQPSEPETGFSEENENNAPGRTPGKAEGSREIVEEDLKDKEN